jgi:hypothetical protein
MGDPMKAEPPPAIYTNQLSRHDVTTALLIYVGEIGCIISSAALETELLALVLRERLMNKIMETIDF